MEGVTILSSIERNVKGVQIAWLIAGIVVAVVCLIGLIVSLVNENDADTIFAVLLISAVCMIWISSRNLKNGQYTQYKVLIDDSVSMTEFTEKYEVIDQDGQIWTIKGKTKND